MQVLSVRRCQEEPWTASAELPERTDRALDPIRPSTPHRIDGARFIESLVEMRRR